MKTRECIELGSPWGTEARDELPRFPDDAREWVDEPMLVRFVFDAVAECNRDLPAGPARVLLTVLTYSYAIGLYGSEEIEDQLAHDAQLEYLSAKATLSACTLRQFRRYHRDLLQASLSALFQRVWQSRAQQVNPDKQDSNVLLGRRGGRLEGVFQRAANRRIADAVLADSIELDV
jgi:hypothetical protein